MSNFEYPTQGEIDEVTEGDYSQVQTPSEALGVTEEDIATVDQEAFEKTEGASGEE